MIIKNVRVRHNWCAPCVTNGPIQLGELHTSDFAGPNNRTPVVQGNVPKLGATLACRLWVASKVTVTVERPLSSLV